MVRDFGPQPQRIQGTRQASLVLGKMHDYPARTVYEKQGPFVRRPLLCSDQVWVGLT